MKVFFFSCFLLWVSGLLAQNSVLSTAIDTTVWSELDHRLDSLFEAGDFEAALPISQLRLAQIEQWIGPGYYSYSTWLENVGVCLHHVSRLEEAAPYLERAIEFTRANVGTEHEDYVIQLCNLAMLRQDMGEYSLALNALEEVVERGKRIWGESNPYYGIMVNNLALAYENVKEYAQALKYYQQALELTEKTVGKSSIKYALRLHNLACTYRHFGQYDRAIPLFEEALRIVKAQGGKQYSFYINALYSLSTTYLDMGNPERALEIEKEAVMLADEKLGRKNHLYPNYLGQLGTCYIHLGRLGEGRAAFTEAESLARQIANNSDWWPNLDWLYESLGSVCDRSGDYDAAAAYYVQLANLFVRKTQTQFDQLNQVDQESQLTYWYAKIRAILSFSIRHPEQTAVLEKAFDVNLLMKGMSLDYHRRLLGSLRHTADTATAQTFIEWAALERKLAAQYSLPADKQPAYLPDLQYRAQELERRLAATSASFREARQVINWHDVQQTLRADEAAVEFCAFRYLRPDGQRADSTLYVAFVLRKDDVQPRMIYLFSENQLPNLQAIRTLYSADAGGSATLHDLIWKPLAGALNGISTIYYAPAGLLYRINFGAIPFDREQTLSQHYRLYQLGSTRQLALSGQDYSGKTAVIDAAIFGGIDYDTPPDFPAAGAKAAPPANPNVAVDNGIRGFPAGNRNPWPFLEWTGREADAISNLLQSEHVKVDLHKGSAATEEQFKRICSGPTPPTVVHLATHGFFFPDRDLEGATAFLTADDPMMRSGLVLAGANRVWQGQAPLPGREDGILTAYEISLLNFHHTELVVLSACDTGLGENKGNEGVYGLQRAFKMAGARYLLMSLWQTSDRLTQTFMTLFYREWLVNKQEIPAAFQSAQNQLKEQYRVPYNPSMWAAFILVE